MPASMTVGRFGKAGKRFALVTASGMSRPALAGGPITGRPSSTPSTWLRRRSSSAGPPPVGEERDGGAQAFAHLLRLAARRHVGCVTGHYPDDELDRRAGKILCLGLPERPGDQRRGDQRRDNERYARLDKVG